MGDGPLSGSPDRVRRSESQTLQSFDRVHCFEQLHEWALAGDVRKFIRRDHVDDVLGEALLGERRSAAFFLNRDDELIEFH